jgi:acetyltransferase-like isoleucine patch superfamily enzyme
MTQIKLFLFALLRHIREYLVLRQVESHKNEIFIGGKTRLSNKTTLGKNPNFNGMTINGYGKVVFGDNFHSGTECLIITSNHNYDKGTKIPYDATHILKDVVIGDNVWFGDRVIILGGVTIGEGAIIQAGAVVVNDIPAGGIAGGNPAKVFKYRDMAHYYDLKSKGLSH